MQHEPPRELLGQRHDGKLFRHAEEGLVHHESYETRGGGARQSVFGYIELLDIRLRQDKD